MIPNEIVQYLQNNGARFVRHPHPRAISAQELAASMHVTGFMVAKSVVVRAGGDIYIAVLPAPEMLDPQRFAEAIGAQNIELADESEFDRLFPNCEIGAEPPFGGLYNLPVVVDAALADEETIVFRAGSHEEAIEMSFEDFARIERPQIATIAQPFMQPEWAPQPEMHV
jgi:Ala-tRNA(Pro) deacylase